MKKAIIITLLIPLAALLLSVLVGVCFHIWETRFYIPAGKGRWESTSPDGRYTVAGYVLKGLAAFIPTMPGDGGSGPGIILLRDNKTEKVLQMERVDSVISYNRVEWYDKCIIEEKYDRCVDVRILATWPLPPKDENDIRPQP